MPATKMVGSLRFLHITDPHLTSLESARWWQLLNKRVLGYGSWARRRRFTHRGSVLDILQRQISDWQIDRILLTGDVTHIGLPQEFDEARDWLLALEEVAPVLLIPGNHETYARAPWQNTLHLWQPWLQPASEGNARAIEAADYPVVWEIDEIVVIGINSAVATMPLLATGTVGGAQRERLRQLLDRYRSRFRLLMIHHPPLPGSIRFRKRLTDAKPLSEIVARHGAELVLHGHSHRWQYAEITGANGLIPVSGAPSASAFSDQFGGSYTAGVSLIDVENRNKPVLQHFSFDADQEMFRPLVESPYAHK